MYIKDLKPGDEFTRPETFDTVYKVEEPIKIGGGYAQVRYSVRGYRYQMLLRSLSTCTLIKE